MKLNLGSGMRRVDGYINVDRENLASTDEMWDLEIFPWPWGDSSTTEILMTHVLEHLGETPSVFLKVMKEIYRVLTPGGTCTIRVPHHHCDNFWNDPTHVRPVTPQVLSLFSKKNCQAYAEDNAPNTPLALYLNIDLELTNVSYALLPPYAEQWNKGQITQSQLDYMMNTHWNVVDEVTMILTKPPE
jgi:SAM-dependent methyltransferase